MLSILTVSVTFAKCQYASYPNGYFCYSECRFAECRGAISISPNLQNCSDSSFLKYLLGRKKKSFSFFKRIGQTRLFLGFSFNQISHCVQISSTKVNIYIGKLFFAKQPVNSTVAILTVLAMDI
jgi:hypothetical protein